MKDTLRNDLHRYVEAQREESRRLVKLAENARLRANLLAASADEAAALARLNDNDLSDEDFEKIKDRLERRVSVLEPLALGVGIDEKTLGDLKDWLNRHTNYIPGPGPTSPTAVEDAALWPR